MTTPSSSPMTHLGLLASALAALTLAACDAPTPKRTVASSQEAATAACTGTGAHDRHQAMGVACTVCHPGDGGSYGFAAYTYPEGTSTADGVVLLASGGNPTTCTVACHAPIGSPAHPVTWDTAGPLDCTACHTPSYLPPAHPAVANPSPSTADCLGCHDQSQHTQGTVKLRPHPASWMDQADAGFHAVSANQGLGACEACHGPNLDGGAAKVACGSCHDQSLPAGVTTWSKNCLMCHGGTDDQTGAPPRTTWGNSADLVRVGAHGRHVGGSAISPPFDCELCHVKPTDARDQFHIDQPTARVTFGGRAVKAGTTPAWDRTTATCSNVACHGVATPVWTGGPAQAQCGTCHALPPPSPHPTLADASLTGCVACHPATMSPDGTLLPPAQGGMHLDGMVQSSGHDASWMDTASAGFHGGAISNGLAPCQACHGADLDGGTAQVACGSCHDQHLPAGVTTWRKNCTMCHGGVDDQTGAPPRTTWGHAADLVRVGAHTVHLAGGAVAGPVACTSCHQQFADALDPGHIANGIAHLSFGGLAVAGNARPAWDRSTATCSSTYCHGGYSGTFTYFFFDANYTTPYAGANGAPLWTDGPMTCTSCHGNPPDRTATWHRGHPGGTDCQLCHPNAVGVNGVGTGITNPATHVDGNIDLAPQWNPKCFNCH